MAEKVCLQLLCPNVDHQPKIRHFLDHGIGYNWTIYPWYLLCLHCSYKSTSYGWRRALDEISKDAASCLDCLARSFYLTSLLLMVWWYDTYFYSIPHFSRAQMHLVVCVCVGGGVPSFAGLYLCKVSNTVGAERCRVVLEANKSKKFNRMFTSMWHYGRSRWEQRRPRFHPFQFSAWGWPPRCPIFTHCVTLL